MARESILTAAWRMNRTLPLLIAVVLLLDLILFGAMNFIVVPEIDALEGEFLSRQKQVRQLRGEDALARAPQDLLRLGREDLVKFREAIPPKEDFTSLIAELFAMAEETDLDIDRVSYQPEEIPERQLLRYSLSFSVGGGYGQIKRFISLLERSPRLIVIDEIALSGESQEGEVGLRMRLSTYFRMEEP